MRKKVGQAFLTVSKKQYKHKVYGHKYKLYKVGERAYFQHLNERYYCEVRAVVTVETGIVVTSFDPKWTNNFKHNCWKGPRWWRFTYLVIVLKPK